MGFGRRNDPMAEPTAPTTSDEEITEADLVRLEHAPEEARRRDVIKLLAEVRRLRVPKIYVGVDFGQASPFCGDVGAIIAYRGAPPSVHDVLAEREACAVAVQDLDAEAASLPVPCTR